MYCIGYARATWFLNCPRASSSHLIRVFNESKSDIHKSHAICFRRHTTSQRDACDQIGRGVDGSDSLPRNYPCSLSLFLPWSGLHPPVLLAQVTGQRSQTLNSPGDLIVGIRTRLYLINDVAETRVPILILVSWRASDSCCSSRRLGEFIRTQMLTKKLFPQQHSISLELMLRKMTILRGHPLERHVLGRTSLG